MSLLDPKLDVFFTTLCWHTLSPPANLWAPGNNGTNWRKIAKKNIYIYITNLFTPHYIALLSAQEVKRERLDTCNRGTCSSMRNQERFPWEICAWSGIWRICKYYLVQKGEKRGIRKILREKKAWHMQRKKKKKSLGLELKMCCERLGLYVSKLRLEKFPYFL